ncbi:EAL domain-containing protein [Caballeronia sp. DA-9]|uniref:EAL domain-containing protein n=1 Tax=Caballeronia sp. DA-9 TaxID=3436237 RepID=UPI003F67302E
MQPGEGSVPRSRWQSPWDHPQFGRIWPAEFIPLVEQTALISSLTDWVLNSALMQISQWREQSPAVKVSVNIAASDLGRPDFVERVINALEIHGMPGENLELEITDGAMFFARSMLSNATFMMVSVHLQIRSSNIDTLSGEPLSCIPPKVGRGHSTISGFTQAEAASPDGMRQECPHLGRVLQAQGCVQVYVLAVRPVLPPLGINPSNLPVPQRFKVSYRYAGLTLT